MAQGKKNPGQIVFGLDIGTRTVIGTVGFKTDETFHVVAQYTSEHETRSMLDGQIHDIEKVGRTIKNVKSHLESVIGKQLHEVCIAAAGRVLRTITTNVTMEFSEEVTVDPEMIYNLETLGIEKAYDELSVQNDTDVKFYCVGYTVVKYYLNGNAIGALDRHKARNISVELIATFLPDEVVDGLYKAVEIADLEVANLTLEPIAAMTCAIPQMYRMLNIALVDVGAGTSDISITKDGSIIAYGMIPKAGDELTEAIAKALLLDFREAERVKLEAGKKKTIIYTDIMGLQQKIEPKDLQTIVQDVIDNIAHDVSEKIKELNGDKPVSAVFVVGGGGKIPGFTDALAKEMGILAERVALRGEEVLKEIDYQFEKAVKDSTHVTPIGICLNFYEQRNNFIFVIFNDKRIKLYDNGHLTVADAAMQDEFPNDGLFPKRGKELDFVVNGKLHMVRGELGEPALITLNGKNVSLTAPIQAGDKIEVKESTAGAAATATIASLLEFGKTISVNVNDKHVMLPQFAQVNGELQSEFYEICENDDIKMLNYYTVGQIAQFMDVILKKDMNIYVNNKIANLDTKVYDNFSVIWSMEELKLSDVVIQEENHLEEDDFNDDEDFEYDEEYEAEDDEDLKEDSDDNSESESNSDIEASSEESVLEEDSDARTSSQEEDSQEDSDAKNSIEEEALKEDSDAETSSKDEISAETSENEDTSADDTESTDEENADETDSDESKKDKVEIERQKDGTFTARFAVYVNGDRVVLSGKKDYIFVDVFEFIDFDTSKPEGRSIVTKVNGERADYTQLLVAGDQIEIYWEN